MDTSLHSLLHQDHHILSKNSALFGKSVQNKRQTKWHGFTLHLTLRKALGFCWAKGPICTTMVYLVTIQPVASITGVGHLVPKQKWSRGWILYSMQQDTRVFTLYKKLFTYAWNHDQLICLRSNFQILIFVYHGMNQDRSKHPLTEIVWREHFRTFYLWGHTEVLVG